MDLSNVNDHEREDVLLARIEELEAQLRQIVRHYDMRAEIYSGDGKDAALAWVMANLASDVLTEAELQKSDI